MTFEPGELQLELQTFKPRFLSLTPNFSCVYEPPEEAQPFQRFQGLSPTQYTFSNFRALNLPSHGV